MSPDTWAVLGGRGHSRNGEPLNVPLVLASNFVLGGERVYSREQATETWEAFEALLGGWERGEAVAFASGMAAVAAIFDLLPSGAQVLIPGDCYQRVTHLADAGQHRGRWSVSRLPAEDTAAWRDAVGSADLVWLESPSNPLLVVADLPSICAAPRRDGGLIVVDNTLATPLAQQPLGLGADVALHSATKYIGGHGDLLLGVAVAASPRLAAQLRERRALAGAVPGAMETFLALRGARTLPLRLRHATATATELARRLAEHPAVTKVLYPGLPDHPTHQIARETLDGYGAVMSFEVSGGGERADRLCDALRVIRHATSFGGVESTIERRAVHHGQEHLPASLLRLSIGSEQLEDLWRDLEQALTSSG